MDLDSIESLRSLAIAIEEDTSIDFSDLISNLQIVFDVINKKEKSYTYFYEILPLRIAFFYHNVLNPEQSVVVNWSDGQLSIGSYGVRVMESSNGGAQTVFSGFELPMPVIPGIELTWSEGHSSWIANTNEHNLLELITLITGYYQVQPKVCLPWNDLADSIWDQDDLDIVDEVVIAFLNKLQETFSDPLDFLFFDYENYESCTVFFGEFDEFLPHKCNFKKLQRLESDLTKLDWKIIWDETPWGMTQNSKAPELLILAKTPEFIVDSFGLMFLESPHKLSESELDVLEKVCVQNGLSLNRNVETSWVGFENSGLQISNG